MEDKNDIMGCLHVLRLSQSELLGCCQKFQLNGKRIKNFNAILVLYTQTRIVVCQWTL